MTGTMSPVEDAHVVRELTCERSDHKLLDRAVVNAHREVPPAGRGIEPTASANRVANAAASFAAVV